MPERRGRSLRCPALKKWITDHDCKVRREAPFCISCNPCPLKSSACEVCGKTFTQKSPYQIYCRPACKRVATNRKRRANRWRRKTQGVCVYCGKNTIDPDRSRLGCNTCLNMHVEARRRRSASAGDARV